ncbi:hypothetical protein ID866_7056 [Astraeus odoratus]|nr:hypothetical protein ID866_7056 [Astraeus odoratus]
MPICVYEFLSAIRQCIEHVVFMHRHHIVHLDISLYNFVTDYCGRYACIDYELSQRIDNENPRVFSSRGTEIPPELELGQSSNPYTVDIWALAMLILRACDVSTWQLWLSGLCKTLNSQITGFHVPELIQLTKPMLNENADKRPSASMVLRAFRRQFRTLEDGLGPQLC